MDQPTSVVTHADQSDRKRPWSPPTIKVVDVPAQTEGTFAGVGADNGVYS